MAFDRFLARLLGSERRRDYPWILKGGYAMELRMQLARATKDIDLGIPVNANAEPTHYSSGAIRALLQDAASLPLPDGFTFLIGEAKLELDAAPQGGSRFPVHASMAGCTFARFSLDVGIADELIEPAELVQGEGWFDFAGLPRPEFRMISREQQFAEKLHAYTLPRTGAENTHAKDLVDVILLLRMALDSARMRDSLQRTFVRRNTHPVPIQLDQPPSSWRLALTRWLASATYASIWMQLLNRSRNTLLPYGPD
ncbi:MAG: nucleotidyl transferase AbiEii/AbiGii toxin family protein [Terriglobia bacterium]